MSKFGEAASRPGQINSTGNDRATFLGGAGDPVSISGNTLTPGSAAGTVVGDISGLKAGEVVKAIIPNDGRLVLANGGSRVQAGSTAIGSGPLEFTLITDVGREYTLILNPPVGTAASPIDSAFAPMKAKLDTGQNVTLLAMTDSTGHTPFGPYYKFAKALGDIYHATVNLIQWGEFRAGDVAYPGTGPKAYNAPVVLRTGTGPTITIYLLSLPGSVPSFPFDGTRRAAAIDALPTPDVIIMQQGHNMLGYNVSSSPASLTAAGDGLLMSAIGMMSLRWPNVPQAMVIQNPRRDDTNYDKMRNAMLAVFSALPSLTMIDGYTPFINAGKSPGLYRAGSDGNIHPADSESNSTGAQLTADALMNVFVGSRSLVGFSTVSWPNIAQANLLDNGDFTLWTGTNPTGWTPSGTGCSLAKDTTVKYGSAAYSCAVTPGSTTGANLNKLLSDTEIARMAGKSVSVMALVYQPSTLTRKVVGNFVARYQSPPGRTFVMGDILNCQDGWIWIGVDNVLLDATIGSSTMSIAIYPMFNAVPSSQDPLRVQKVIVVEGPLPKGGL